METSNLKENRRNFLKTIIPVGGTLCIGCKSLLDAQSQTNRQDKFSKKSQKKIFLTLEQYFSHKYDYYIGIMKKFTQYMDEETVLTMIKKANDEYNQSIKPNMEAKSVTFIANAMLENKIYKMCLDMETVELTDKVFEVKITNCLWAKTFRKKKAAALGYATMCHGDFSSTAAQNPKLKLERTKTLMEGHDCCNHRFTWND